jgi:hypothetical protein
MVNVRSNMQMISLGMPFLKNNSKSNRRMSSSITILTTPDCNKPNPSQTVQSISAGMVKQLV